jgi:hypothetical protein
VRGSRRSFATRPRRSAPDASRSRQAPIREAAGHSIQPVVADSGESPTPSAGSGSLAGALALWVARPFQPAHRRCPDPHPGSLQDGAQTLFSVNGWPESCPVAYPIRRTAQGRGRIDRKAGRRERRQPPFRPFAERASSHGRRPAPDDWRPLREAIARNSSAPIR